jgi:hypothetical protein
MSYLPGDEKHRNPERALLQLLRREFDIEASEAEIRQFVESHWARLSTLAHAIHRQRSVNT